MVRILITSLLAGTCAFAQTAGAPPVQAPSRPPATQPSAPPLVQQQSFNPDKVAPNEAVVVVHGVCPKNAASAKTGSKDVLGKDGSCQTVITKEQFNTMLSGMSLTSQITTPSAMRNFAESYSQLLSLADAG